VSINDAATITAGAVVWQMTNDMIVRDVPGGVKVVVWFGRSGASL
jgi:hypothetical protein